MPPNMLLNSTRSLNTAQIKHKTKTQNRMKKLIVPILAGLSAMTLLTGCIGLTIGGGTTNKPVTATVGQQLVDLQKAKDIGAITDAEYQAQRTKILNER